MNAVSDNRLGILRIGLFVRRKQAEVNQGLADLGFTTAEVSGMVTKFGLPAEDALSQEAWVATVSAASAKGGINPDNLALLLQFLQQMAPLFLQMCPTP